MTQNFAKFCTKFQITPSKISNYQKNTTTFRQDKENKKVLNSHNITLLYAAKDTKNNQAIILKDFIENIKSGA